MEAVKPSARATEVRVASAPAHGWGMGVPVPAAGRCMRPEVLSSSSGADLPSGNFALFCRLFFEHICHRAALESNRKYINRK